MSKGLTSRLLIGPYGLHAVLLLFGLLFAAFLLVFNLTTFF